MHIIAAKANSQPQIMKNPLVEELKHKGPKLLSTLHYSNNLKPSTQAWQEEKKIAIGIINGSKKVLSQLLELTQPNQIGQVKAKT